MRAKRRASVNRATAAFFFQMSPTWMNALPYVSRSWRGPLLDGVAEGGLADHRPVGRNLVGRCNVAQQHVPVTLEIAAGVTAQRVRKSRRGRPVGADASGVLQLFEIWVV